MATMALSTPRERIGGAVAALGVTGAMFAALVLGLAARERFIATDESVAIFEVTPDRPEPKRDLQRMAERNTRPSGTAAPPNSRSRATSVEVPVPEVPVPAPPPPFTVAPQKSDGTQASSGAAPDAGPSTGAGGVGDGLGGGGDGDGDGAGDRDATPPRQIRGRISYRDYPENLSDAGIGGRVTVLYRVETDGRVGECDVIGSSGNRQLDAWTCQLIQQRFRFRPSIDGRGRAVPSLIRENHYWTAERSLERD